MTADELAAVVGTAAAHEPLPGDHRRRLLITGDELRELKRHTGAMAEAFGLDRKIDNYKGSRPITLYRWDLECLMDVIGLGLKDERDYPDKSSAAYLALESLGDRLHHEYDSVYGHEESPPTLVSKKATGRTLKKPSAGKAAQSDDKVYQFKVTLLDTRPSIWRRIQVIRAAQPSLSVQMAFRQRAQMPHPGIPV